MNIRSLSLLIVVFWTLALSHANAQVLGSGKTNYEIGVQAFKQGDFRRAFDAWSLGAYEENAEAQYNLGVLYLEGRGVERNVEQARNWFLRAADKNQLEAQYNLGHMALSGIGIDKDVGQALRWWKSASMGGYPQAQFNYGRALYLGIGNQQDIPEGLRLMRLAAAQKDTRAEEFLSKSAEEIAEHEKSLLVVQAEEGASKLDSKPIQQPDKNTQVKKVAKLTPKKKLVAESEQGTKTTPSVTVSARKQDIIASKQVAALDQVKAAKKPEVTPQVVALDPVLAKKPEATTVARQAPKLSPKTAPKKPVPVSENQVIALDEHLPIPTKKALPKKEILIQAAKPKADKQQTSLDSKVQIVRDTSPVQRDYFLRTINSPVKVYSQADFSQELDTLLPQTLVRVIAKQSDKLQIEIAPGLPAWVKRVEVQLQDGYASVAQNSVRLYTHPDGEVIGELPHQINSLIIEQRRKWLRLRIPQSIYGWIDARSLADSGENAQELMVQWVRETHAVIGAAKLHKRPAEVKSITLTQVGKSKSSPVQSSAPSLSPKKQSTLKESVQRIEEKVVVLAPAVKTPIAVGQDESTIEHSTVDRKINDNAWLFTQSEGAYVIHLFTVLDHKAALLVAQSKALQGNSHFFTTRIKDKDWSFVLLGPYPDEQTAKLAIDKLPRKHVKNARARQISLIANNRCKKRDALSDQQANDLSVLCK